MFQRWSFYILAFLYIIIATITLFSYDGDFFQIETDRYVILGSICYLIENMILMLLLQIIDIDNNLYFCCNIIIILKIAVIVSNINSQVIFIITSQDYNFIFYSFYSIVTKYFNIKDRKKMIIYYSVVFTGLLYMLI